VKAGTVKALREALLHLNNDKAHAEDSQKTLGYAPVKNAPR
jgi:hypothetical protein